MLEFKCMLTHIDTPTIFFPVSRLFPLAYHKQKLLLIRLLITGTSIKYFVVHCSVAQSRLTLRDPIACSTSGYPSFTISRSLLKLMSIESVLPSNHLVLCFSPSPPAFNLSQHQGLFYESTLCIRWPKDCLPNLCKHCFIQKSQQFWGFPDGPVVKNLASNAGDTGLIPGQETKPRGN